MSAPLPHDPPWPDVERLFLSLLDLGTGERTLALAAETDAEVRAAVASLLAAHDASGGFLAALADAPLSTLIGDDLDRDAGEAVTFEPGDRVGAWRLVREVGRGGMGVVWLAERADGAFAQRVALKLLPPDAGGAFGPRLVRERHALARLAHPAIARLLGGGETDAGQPFFAMEYVDGEPITAWADARRLPVAARVALFAEAVEAVRHAHRHLVVHRDLKPSNVFVCEGEPADAGGRGRATVKLLDFGLARLLDPDAGPDAGPDTEPGDAAHDPAEALTLGGVRPMTPEYAAPEQVRGEAVTTATDVYALGVVLYELLAGRRPFAFPDRRAATIAHVLGTAVLVPPSRAVREPDTAGGPTPEAVAGARGTTPARLARALRGDLDAITARSLARDPADRYQSADALAADLARWAAHRPVAAGRGRSRLADARTVAARFVRRNRLGVAAAAAVGLALAAGVVGTLVQARAARAEAARAEATRDFVLGVFADADPAEDAAAVTARELIDAAAADVSRGLASQPETQAEMQRTLGDLYSRLSLYEPAAAQFAASARREAAFHRAPHDHTAQALDALAAALADLGEVDRAAAAGRQAVAVATAAGGAGSTRAAVASATLARILSLQGDNAAADALAQSAVRILRVATDADPADVADAMSHAGVVRRSLGDLAGAERLAREAYGVAQARLGPDHLDTMSLLNNLAIILRERSELVEAERAFRRVLAFDLRRLGPDHVFVATVRSNLASVVVARGFVAAAGADPASAQPLYAEGERLYRQVLAASVATLGDGHPFTAAVMMQLAGVLREQGHLAEAEPLARGAAERTPNPADPVLPWIDLERGRIALAQNDLGAADRFITRATGAVDTTLAPDDSRRSTALVALARLRRRQGRTADAVRLADTAVRVALAAGGPDHFRTQTARRARAEVGARAHP